MRQPQVSVIIPNRNRRGVVDQAVDSVLSQEGVEFELLLVDDASDQPAEDLYARVASLGHRVLRGQVRRGPGPCRNWGAREASGRWLAFLDSDDHWLPARLMRQCQGLGASGLRVGQVDELWYRDGVRVKPLKAHRIEGGDLYQRSLRAICVSPSAVMVERSLFAEVGGFDEELFVCEDYDFWLRVAAREMFHVIPEPLAVKTGGHADQLSKMLPAMDRFRIRSLCKGLLSGAYGQRWEAARDELLRKVEILGRGSAKHGTEKAVQLCARLEKAAAGSRWAVADRLSKELMAVWPLSP